MNSESVIGAIIMCAVCFGCGALFIGIGVWADKRMEPMNFWAGVEVKSSTVSDISAYNHANSVMWKCYSTPYWLAGLLSLFAVAAEWLFIAALVLLILACIPGLVILIRHYRQIEKMYIRNTASSDVL